MEIIPVLSRLNGLDFEARLQNPSFISKILHIFSGGIQDVSQISSFWTLGALIIAFLATFTKFKLILLRLQKISRKLIFSSSQQTSSSQPSISSPSDFDDETCSSSGSSISSLSDFDSEEEYTEYYDEQDDFRVAGSSNYEEEQGHSFTWSDFANRGKSVVKSWPEGLNLALGLGLDNPSCSLVSLWDNNNGKNSNNSSNFGSSSCFFGQSMLSPAVIVSAGLIENSKNVAEWQPCWKRVLSNGCLNNNSMDAVRDLRNVRAPVTDHQSITQWINLDDSEMVNGRDIGNYLAGTNDSVVSRCLSAYFTL